MPCYGPLTGYYSKELSGSGKRKIVFKKADSLTGIPLQLPCGQCIGCRLERSRQWAMRLVHEKRMHERSAFLTLTYDNEHLPPGGSLVVRDFQLFMKRLRKHAGIDRVRFFACGEYGDLNARPHYHAILFGYDFVADQRLFTRNSRGEPIYTSEVLRELWPMGFNAIGEVTFQSAAYVARYVVKKVTGERAADHYCVVDGDGVAFDRVPEFTLMSRRPGIGSSYYEKFGERVRQRDTVVVNGREVPPPRFYDAKTELLLGGAFAKLKRERKRKALLNRADNTSGYHGRLRVKEVLALKLLEQKKRKI